MSKFSLKLSVVAVMVALLSACQSTSPTLSQQVQPTTQSALSKSTKDRLLGALQHHLSNERYVVSVSRTQALPLYDVGSPNKDADPIWGSVMKVSEFRRNHDDDKEQPYRTESEYLGWQEQALDGEDTKTQRDELPYLRYDDEKNSTSVNTITRAEAWDDKYQTVNQQIDELSVSVYRQLLEFHENIENLQDNSATKQVLTQLNKHQKDLKNTLFALKKQAKGYQRGSLQTIEGCVDDYVLGAREILQGASVNKNKAELLGQTHQMCLSGHALSNTLMPYVYTKEGYTERHLKATHELLTCQKDSLMAQRALRRAGKTYLNDEKAHVDSHLKFAQCASDVLGDGDEIENLDDARSVLYEVRYAVLDSKLSSYSTRERKYGGPTGWLDAYRDMKAQGDKGTKKTNDDESAPSFGRFGIYGSMMASMLEYAKKSPEQLSAQNLYQYNHTKATILAHHDPKSRQGTMIWSLDFESPTARQSAQLPVKMDFGSGQMTADVSALLPVMALIAPKQAPLPDEIPNGLMHFKAPNELAQKIPSTVIYDAISRGVLLAMAELDEEKFTLVAQGDSFAQTVGAKEVIKVNLTTKEFGQMSDVIAKVVVEQLNAYVDAHPDIYPDVKATKNDRQRGIKKGDNAPDRIKSLIKDFATFNQAHRSSDVGGLWQIVEGILPFGVDMVSYLYLDGQGKLIATQNITNIDDEIHDYRLKNTTQIQYDKAVFDSHVLSGQFKSAFNAPAQIDGVAWLKSTIDDYRFAKEAKEARQRYEYLDDDNDGADDHHDGGVVNGAEDPAKTAAAFQQKERS